MDTESDDIVDVGSHGFVHSYLDDCGSVGYGVLNASGVSSSRRMKDPWSCSIILQPVWGGVRQIDAADRVGSDVSAPGS